MAFVAMVCGAYTWLALVALSSDGSVWLLAGMGGAIPASFSCWRLLAYDGDVRQLVPAQAATLANFILMSAGCGLGYLVSH